jgi:hypothetical protein
MLFALRAWLAPILVGAPLLLGCGGSKGPAKHPAGAMAMRNVSRAEIVELVVADEERAAQVKAAYLEIWKLGFDFDRERNAVLLEYAALANKKDVTVEELQNNLLRVREAGRSGMNRYITLVQKIRANTTKKEFERLSAFH